MSTCKDCITIKVSRKVVKERNHFLLSVFLCLLLLLDLLGALLGRGVGVLLVRLYQKFRRPVQLGHRKRHCQAVFRSVQPFSLKLNQIGRGGQNLRCVLHLVHIYFSRLLFIFCACLLAKQDIFFLNIHAIWV